MTLLEALNLCLRSTGETGVAAIVTSHPKHATILAEIDTVSKRLQRRNWWFNTFTRNLEPIAGEIDTTAYDLVVPVNRAQDYIPLGGILIDKATGDPVDIAVRALVRTITATDAALWADLPDSFTDYVGASAALSFASNYDADPLQLQKLQAQIAGSQIACHADHTRYSKVNLFTSGSAGFALRNAYGNSYGRRM